MKKLTYSVILLAVLLAKRSFAEEAKTISMQDKKNYEIGVQLVRVLIKLGGEINLDMVIKGMRDAVRDETLLVRGKKAQEIGSARVRSLPGNKLRPVEASRAGAGDAAAARMTISGGAGRITATPARPSYSIGQYGYRYQVFTGTR